LLLCVLLALILDFHRTGAKLLDLHPIAVILKTRVATKTWAARCFLLVAKVQNYQVKLIYAKRAE